MKSTNSVGIVATKDSKVILVREEEGSAHLTGMIGLPSGRVEEGESCLDAAVREFSEETGLSAKKEDFSEFPGNLFHADIPRKGGETVNFEWRIFRISNFSGKLKGNDEVTPMWVSISKLPRLQKDGKLLPNVFNAIQAALKIA